MRRLPFFAVDGSFDAIVRDWTTGSEIALVLHDVECTFNLQLKYQCTPLVVLGVNEKVLTQDVIKRTAAMTNPRSIIVALTSTADEALMVGCFRQGADRVVAISQCSANIFQALLQSLMPEDRFSYPPYRLSTSTQTINLGMEEVRLRKKAYDVAQYLFMNNNQMISKARILEDVWSVDAKRCNTRRVETQMSYIKRQLSLDGTYGWVLRNRRYYGYGLFRTEPQLHSPAGGR